MRVFVAGATGAIGRHLVPLLVRGGHQVVGSTRNPHKQDALERAGAEAVVMDGLDRDAVVRAVTAAKPDVVVHELTALDGNTNDLKHMDRGFAVTNRLRTVGTDHLLAAAREAGAGRVVVQSFGGGWQNARTGAGLATEEEPLDPHPAASARETLAGIRYVDETVPAATGLDGLVLRYGYFYGPGTGLGEGGDLIAMVRRRRLPVVGGGAGVWSFVHTADAASATAAALDRGVSGVYHVVDDDPAPVADWLPHLAAAVGAKPPRSLPSWLARPVIGELGVRVMTEQRGSSNAKAKRALGWVPRYPSWREGFRTGLG